MFTDFYGNRVRHWLSVLGPVHELSGLILRRTLAERSVRPNCWDRRGRRSLVVAEIPSGKR
jgi:hypothetical protein